MVVVVTTKSILAFLWIGISNKAITFRNQKELEGSVNVFFNMEKLFDNEETTYSEMLCPKFECSDCDLRANLYTKTTIDDVCIVNAILIHTGAKPDE